jgi:enoyl-CoA hydratase/carnithine racemase
MDDNLIFEQRGAVGLLTLNRPERLNALDLGLLRALLDFFAERASDYGTRVLVLTGAGRAFCAGLDLKSLPEQGAWQPAVGDIQDHYAFQAALAELILRMRRCPQPLVAAVRGAAVGGGLSLALACDLRLGAPDVRFACAFLNLGLGGADMGTSYFLPKLVGASVAADLLYTGRAVAAEEARAIGILNRVVEPEELLPAAVAWAEELVARASPFGLRLTKEALTTSLDGLALETQLRLENRNQVLARQTADAAEAQRAFAAKEAPRWRDA